MNNSEVKTISIILEGGIGDFICGARFIPAIKKAYPNAKLTLFSNTDGKTIQAEFINNLWPSYFEGRIHQVTRKSQECYKTSQFGREIYNAAYDNIIDEDRKLIESANLVRNLHVDGLNWLDYPECLGSFNVFPQEEELFYDLNQVLNTPE